MPRKRYVHQCARCGAKSRAGSEYDCEVWFSAHECKGMRDIGVLSLATLRRLALGEITEEQAFAEHDKEKTNDPARTH